MESNPQANNEPAILAVFNETNYRNPNVDATLITNESSTFKKLDIKGDVKLIQEVKKLFEKDMRRPGASIVEKWEGGKHKYNVSFFMPDGSPVSMSLEEEDPDNVLVWISF